MFVLGAREQGFGGPIVALIENPHRRAPIMLAGATSAFTPNHVLAAVLAARASSKISPRVAGVQPLGRFLAVAELRVHSASPLAHKTLAEAQIRPQTGAIIIGQWLDDALRSPPGADQQLQPGTILIAIGAPESIRRLGEMVRPITQDGILVVVGFGTVAQQLAAILNDAGEEMCVIDADHRPGVDQVGDILDPSFLAQTPIADARVVIIALNSDSTALLTATMIRDYAPDTPIIAGVAQLENVDRIQQAGADFALSVGQVAGQILARHILGATVSHQTRIKLVKLSPGQLVGQHPLKTGIRERTGCSVVAVERGGQILLDLPPSFILTDDDALYICGTATAFNRYFEEFPTSL